MPRIGFVGLGTMGGQMARRLVEQGYQVTGFDIDAERSGRAEKSGVTRAASPAGAPEAPPVVE
jgi:3-hydroxyisobutyrate dehydrogenase-like beta-hydroxyacid dehydrogenase